MVAACNLAGAANVLAALALSTSLSGKRVDSSSSSSSSSLSAPTR
jgi:hypothetical protein